MNIKALIIHTVVLQIVLSCSNDKEAKIDNEQFLRHTLLSYEVSKSSSIADTSVILDKNIQRLESLCEDIKANDLKDQCNKQLNDIRNQTDLFKNGEWDGLPKVSLEEYTKVYLELIKS